MNESEFNELRETSWRRDLTPAEEARLRSWLAERPGERADWEAEAGLNHLLDRLPDAPVASNFTALVLQEARREAARPARPLLVELWRKLFPRQSVGVAWAVVILCLVGLAYDQNRSKVREQRASELATLGRAVPADPGLLADFDAILQLPPPDDDELFAVLTQ